MSEKQDQQNQYREFNHSFHDRFEDRDVEVSVRFRRPTMQQTARAQKAMLKNAGQAMRNLVLDAVHPEDRDALARDLEAWPGIASTFGNALLSSVGFGDLGN